MEINATLLVQLAMFLFLLAFLSRFLFGPLLKLVEEREKRIEGAASEAKLLRASADQAAGTIDEQMAKAHADAKRVLQDLREKGAATEREHVEKARADAAARLEDARAELFAASEDARKRLKAEAATLANDVVARVLGRAA
jgi:F-type H+-transporting ATPase subunit b